MHKGLMLLILISCTAIHAGDTSQDFGALKSYAKSLSESPMQAMNQFHPESIFENYNANPSQSQYYQGVETEKTDLSQASNHALEQDAGGKTVSDNFGKNQFEINLKNDAIQRAKLIEEESYAITHGISNDKVSCEEKPAVCEHKTVDEICYTSRQLPDQQCSKQRKVSVTSEQINQRADFSFVVSRRWTGAVTVNLVTGAMTNTQGGSVNTVKMSQPCDSMSSSFHSIQNNGQNAYWVNVTGLPTCSNNGLVTLNITKRWDRAYSVQVTVTIAARSKPYVSEEHWENNCAHLESKQGLCHLKEEHCTNANSTQVINGLPVTRDCWETQATFSCASAPADECRVQKDKGCLQTGSRCSRFEDNACALYEQVYSCPKEVCAAPVTCVKDVFCADGECTEHASTQNQDFGKDISSLAVVGEAGKEFSEGKASLFGGHVAQCKIWSLDLIDCCSDKGWGKKIDLVHCRDEDKALGQAKLNYLVHYLGKFCSKKELGVCIEHKRSYCVFDSKMARIVQEGRLKQLNAGSLGTAKEPVCAGLSIEELQAMDLGAIDFINPVYPYDEGKPDAQAGIAADFKINAPDSHQKTDEITQRIQKKAGGL